MPKYKLASVVFAFLFMSNVHAQCHEDLSFLSNRLPTFEISDIENVRTAILQTNVVEDMKKATSMGYAPQQAIQMILDQASEDDRSSAQALQTSNSTSIDFTSDDSFLRSVKSGNLGFSECDGINGAAMCAAISGKLGAIGSRAEAAEMGCYMRAGTWPR
jgi:hypothetical protein